MQIDLGSSTGPRFQRHVLGVAFFVCVLVATAPQASGQTKIPIDKIKLNLPPVIGEWGPVMKWPVVAVHVSLLPNGELWICPGAAHRVPWETPDAFIARLMS